jgi:ATP-dependent Clp protease protease subunit
MATIDPDLPRIDDEDDEAQASPRMRAFTSFLERRLLEARTLILSGPVTDRMASDCATRAMVLEQMDPERPITILINSPGGSADSGFAIYDIIRFVRPPIRTVVNGLCASAAILIHLAAPKGSRFTLPGSRFLIHQPSTTGRGSASDLDITAREILKLRERYNRIISEATNQPIERVLEDARRDFWLNAEEALKYGLVDRVIREHQEIL